MARTPLKIEPADLKPGDSVICVLEDSRERVIGANVQKVTRVDATGLVYVATGERFEGASFPLSQWHPRPQATRSYVPRLYADTPQVRTQFEAWLTAKKPAAPSVRREPRKRSAAK